ncbi:unnamed protein product [Brassica rapa]|uniref:Leucine-rich repeat-containing N-terminal plant-type domain-containing protein n=1 Tax=Brassica campestris TaxID=3711 RepID=A0A8D9GWG9_BRACM|nr:unnamed protein product [Brassica rapa]
MHSCSERKMIVWILCLVSSLSYPILIFASSPAKHMCHPDERDALWEFKSEFHPSGLAASEKTQRWRNNTDCCTWDGITCDPKTGNVAGLNLLGSSLYGSLRSNSSLFRLQHLQSLDLSSSNLAGILPDSIGNLKNLRVLKLLECNLFGKLPSSLGNLSYLTHLDLDGNDFTGELPDSMGNLNQLTKLILASSKLTGLSYLDLSFWNIRRGVVDFRIFLHLKSLTFLDLSHLSTRSMVDMSLFSHLMSHSVLHISGNNLNISSNLNLPSPIGSLALASCNISEFPKFLQRQTSLFYLDISNNKIKGQVPEWLWSLPGLGYVDLSRNSSNTFKNPFPLLPKSIIYFSASDNQFSGEIPKIICELDSLGKLILSNNNFSGSIPWCFENFNTKLTVLHLQNNSLSGEFPEESISVGLVSLDVSHNQLSGELPKSLINCTYLQFVNVEDNMFNGTFPFWLRVLPGLQFLVLRSNKFHGPLYPPEGSMSFPKLRIFDISKNLFSGALPSDYFAGWNEMSSDVYAADNRQQRFIGVSFSNYSKSVVLTNKGSKMELLGISFNIYKTIDVSENRFEGEISESISLLKELIVLNMSNNTFVGHIPPSLSNMTNLQSLDLSRNRLSGKIPLELEKLAFLAWMNFSYNMFEGPIPQGTQILSRDGSHSREKFDGKGDFGLWKFKMLAQLEIQGLLSVLNDDPTSSKETSKIEEDETDVKTDPKKADKDLRVRSLLSTCLSDVILRKIMHESTALGIWKALEKDYQTKSLPNRIYLKKNMESVSVGLVSLDVSHNQLSGELPKSLINCTYVQFQNVEDNMFNDTFPFWLRVLPGLQFLVLF